MRTARETGRKTGKGAGRTVPPETVLFSLPPTDGTGLGNTRLRALLAERDHHLRQRAYDRLRDVLVAQGKATKGRGRSLMRVVTRPTTPARPRPPARIAISPDPILDPYKTDYRWLVQVYDSVKPTTGTGKLKDLK